ncbi:MAG: sulfate adenylyltransferase subunit CysN [Pseudomonadota bacterium]
MAPVDDGRGDDGREGAGRGHDGRSDDANKADAAEAMATRELLRFLTCGSVDDGKSTLIGRLLYDSKLIFEDQIAQLAADSAKYGTVGDDIDLALLVDGLAAEREQGITIDVAYRYFATAQRAFMVADAPGHEQYTSNMATAASTVDCAVILVDATKGLLPQTKRHSHICARFGIRHVVLAVNKIDLVGFDETTFATIVDAYAAFAEGLGFHDVTAIPLSARHGDNVTLPSARMPWWKGPTLLARLETLTVTDTADAVPLRFPVQWVNRPDAGFRGYAGTLASGAIACGDEVMVFPAARQTKIAQIITADGAPPRARAGEAVTLVLEDDVDVARGDVIASPSARPIVSDQFAAHVLWMGSTPLLPGRTYHMRIGMHWTSAMVTALKHKVDIETGQPLAARKLDVNEIGLCNLSTPTNIVFDAFADNPHTGSFILVDRGTNATIAAGMIDFELRRASNIFMEALAVDKAARASIKQQRPCIVWFTGLSGSGKSTIARLVEMKLFKRGQHTYMLDGDNLRHGLNRDLGFTQADRVENIRRVGEVAKLFVDAGQIAICSFISPFRAERQMVRDIVDAGEFVEVFVDTPLDECIKRDPKGLYAKALKGEIKNFTGIDSPYEAPARADMRIDTVDVSADAAADQVIAWLEANGHIA